MSGPKITVIGAGSYFFGKEVIHKMATSPVMENGTLALVDIDADVLATMKKLAERVFEERGCGVTVEASTERRDVLPGSDFVVLTFSCRNAHYRGVDTELAARHGMRMCSSDTIGPGGVFRALREVPHVVAIARDAHELCPGAWIINFVNPTTVMGMALRRYVPEVRSFALCDGLHEPYVSLKWCRAADLLPEDADRVPPDMEAGLDLKIGGVNHFTWLYRLAFDGEDLLPLIRRKLDAWAEEEAGAPQEKAKPRYNFNYARQLFDIFGAYPTAISHAKEYVPYFQGGGVAATEPEPIRLFDAGRRAREMEAGWAKTCEYAQGKRTVEQFVAECKDDHATDIIESMWGRLGKPFFINTANRGAVDNMPADAFLENRCDIDMHGPRPQPAGQMPPGLLGLQHQILDTHELTAQAAVTGDRALLRRALLVDPIGNNIGDVDACTEDLLEAERDALPRYWY